MTKEFIRKKPIISGTISPLHKKKIDKLVESGEFASISDFLSQAVSEFLIKYEQNDADQNPFSQSHIDLLRTIIREEILELNFEKIEKKGKI